MLTLNPARLNYVNSFPYGSFTYYKGYALIVIQG